MKLQQVLSLTVVALLAALAFISIGGISYALGAASTTTICNPGNSPFVVTGVSWGTQGSPQSSGPGEQDVPLTVGLLYTGTCELTAASFELSLPQPLTAADGSNQTTTYNVSVESDTILAETYQVNIGASAHLGTYTIPLYIGYNTTYYAGIFFQSINVTVSLNGSVKLGYSVNTTSLVPGKVNNLTVSISNAGTGIASVISTIIEAPSQVGVLDQLPTIQSLSPGTTVEDPLQLFVPSGLTGSAVTLSFTASYYDAYSLTETTSQSVGLVVQQTPENTLSLLLTQVNDTTVAGTQSRLAVTLTNGGGSPIYSPSLSVESSSPVIILQTDPINYQPTLQPGASINYYVTVGSSPDSTPGIYGSTVTVTYSDSGGEAHAQTFPIGFVVEGTIHFVFQGVAVSQSTTGLAVSGSLLNEGSTDSYYVGISGWVGSASQNQSSYVGEVDTDTPTPFTLTIPFSAPSAPRSGVLVTLSVSYQDSFGTVSTTVTTVKTNVESASQLALSSGASTSSSSSGSDLVTLVSYSVIVIIVAAAVGGVLLVRRQRSSTRAEKEDRVI